MGLVITRGVQSSCSGSISSAAMNELVELVILPVGLSVCTSTLDGYPCFPSVLSIKATEIVTKLVSFGETGDVLYLVISRGCASAEFFLK